MRNILIILSLKNNIGIVSFRKPINDFECNYVEYLVWIINGFIWHTIGDFFRALTKEKKIIRSLFLYIVLFFSSLKHWQNFNVFSFKLCFYMYKKYDMHIFIQLHNFWIWIKIEKPFNLKLSKNIKYAVFEFLKWLILSNVFKIVNS